MSNFLAFQSSVNVAFKSMIASDANKNEKMFLADVTGDELYAHYLASFPEGSNPMFRERSEHDCSTCRNFIKNLGGVVLIENNKINTVWQGKIDDPVYSVVAKAMDEFVRSKGIKSFFMVGESQYGKEKTFDKGETWNHFSGHVPAKYVIRHNTSNALGEMNENQKLLRRSVLEITDSAVETVLELIDQNSIYRGSEFKPAVVLLKKLKAEHEKAKDKELWFWSKAGEIKFSARIRNSVIGTLLTDLSEGVELEKAVAAFETKVAPSNYKRTSSLVTQKMIDQAKTKVEELGLEESLYRRYANKSDISVNNVLFVDNNVKPLLVGGAFDGLAPTKKQEAKEYKNVDSVTVEKFIKDVLPKAEGVEILLTSELLPHFMSLIAPVHQDSKPLFKWDNNFSWSYDGEVTDSIKERVKRAGGKVDGDIRISLSWHNSDDLDLSVSKGIDRIYFGSKRALGGTLDVDMNAGYSQNAVDPVENIVWNRSAEMKPGIYTVEVNQYNCRGTKNPGYEVEIEIEGQVYSVEHPGVARGRTQVATIQKHKDGTIEVTGTGLKKGSSTSEKWGLTTETWVPVDMIVQSPNFWNGQKIGNEHLFFLLKGCVNPEGTRGFYNEFLRDELVPHRKVFEVLASSLKVGYDDNQLSGVGISTTMKREIQVRVKGNVQRILNVNF